MASFFGDIGNSIAGVFGLGPNARGQYNAFTNQIAPIDPRLQSLVDQQNQQAQSFQQNLPTYEQDQYSVASGNMKQQAANQGQNITDAANNRGLLYSGLNQGAQQQNLGNLSVGLANTKAGIAQNAQNQSNQMNMQAAQSSQGLLDAQDQWSQANYQGQLNAYNQKINNIGAVGGLLGGGEGLASQIF